MDYEVKADTLDASFEAAGHTVELAQLRAEVAGLKAARRPALDGAKAADDDGRKRFVDGYLRRGMENGVEVKSLSANINADGGFAVPKQIDEAIQRIIRDISPIRAISNVVNVGSSQYRKLITLNNVASNWVGDAALRPVLAADTPKFFEIVPPMGEIYAMPTATQSMLDDAAFDVEGWLAEEIAREFARAEGAAYVTGSGVNRPLGFLTSPNSAVSDVTGTRPQGTLQYVPTTVAAGFIASTATTGPQDTIIDLIHSLRPAYRQGAVFVSNSKTLSFIRKLKDTTGQFIWQPSLVQGQPSMLFGYPVIEAEDMPDIAANTFPIAFGNFKAGYLIAERAETRILRDPFSNKPFVNFYATKRVSGIVANSEAIKLLKVAVS